MMTFCMRCTCASSLEHEPVWEEEHVSGCEGDCAEEGGNRATVANNNAMSKAADLNTAMWAMKPYLEFRLCSCFADDRA